MADVVNLFVLYKIIKELTTPFDETDAFELGVIDDKGKLLKTPSTKKEKEAYTYFHRFIFNIKRLMGKVGLSSKLATFATALFLLKEESVYALNDDDLIRGILTEVETLSVDNKLFEEIANSTAAVPGTGDSVADWYSGKKKKGRPRVMNRPINGIMYLKRAAREKNKRKADVQTK